MSTINQIQDELIEEFSIFEDWFDKYARIIDIANELDPIQESQKTAQNIIEGCQSRVWLDAHLSAEGTVIFEGDSDAVIVKGILSLLVKILSNQKPQDIIDADLYFIDQIGLKEHLSPTRSNGLVAMLKQMKFYAIAFQAKLNA